MSERVYRQLIPVLDKNVARLESDQSASSRLSAYGMSVGLLGFCYEFLGDVQTAIQFYTRGLRVNPENDGLLVARGILHYGSSPQAILDLERAVKLNSPLVWPYLFPGPPLLSHQSLPTLSIHVRDRPTDGRFKYSNEPV